VVILGLDAPAEQLRADFKAAAGQTLVKGFAVGARCLAMPPARG
jgi:5-dehydro-2-deoxygluconokinase